MSFNRRRNIFTLGDFHLQYPNPAKAPVSRRQNSDLFERDPFKIQSYNFHYADRPTFPLQNLVNRVSNTQSTAKRFDTFYYNYDFAPVRNNKENTATNKFHEFRRRKFLHDQQQNAPPQFHQQHQEQSYVQLHPQEQHQQQQHHSHRPHLHSPSRQGSRLRPTSTTCGTLGSSTIPTYASSSYMQGVRTAHAAQVSPDITWCYQQQPNYHQHHQQQQQQLPQYHNTCSSSQISLAGGRSARVRRFSEAHTNTSSTELRQAPQQLQSVALTASNTSQASRRPMRTLPATSKTLVASANVQPKRSSCSGCQININIKGLDDSQLGENVTIKIESDLANKSNNPLLTKSNNLTTQLGASSPMPSRLQQPLNITRARSSDTLLIDKHLSKYSLHQREATRVRDESQRATQLTYDRDRSSSQSRSDLHWSRIGKRKEANSPVVLPTKHASKERVPSMVPWQLDRSVRACFGKDEAHSTSNTHTNTSVSASSDLTRPKNRMRRIRANYNSALNDLKNLRDYEKLPTTRTTTSEHKLLNTINLIEKSELLPPNTRRQESSHSLHSSIVNHNNNNIGRSRLSDSQFHCLSPNGLSFNNRKNPLNVNINVYADKLKLLRV